MAIISTAPATPPAATSTGLSNLVGPGLVLFLALAVLAWPATTRRR